MKSSWMTFVCGLQTGILATIAVMFFIPGPEPSEGGCSCSTQKLPIVLDSREICGLPEVVTTTTEKETVKVAKYRPSLGEYIFTAARRCRPCGTNCRCGAICRCPK